MNDNDTKKFYDIMIEICTKSVQSILDFENHGIPKSAQGAYKEATGLDRGIIYTLCFYKWNSETDIVSASTDLLIRMVKQQSLPNGNKRCAVLFTYNFLEFLGYKLNCEMVWNWVNLLDMIAASKIDDEIYQEIYSFLEVIISNREGEFHYDNLFEAVENKLYKKQNNYKPSKYLINLINILSRR